MPSIRSFFFLSSSIFLSFLLTSCTGDSGGESGRYSSLTGGVGDEVSSGTTGVTIGENIGNESSGVILTSQEEQNIRLKYRDVSSRDFIPYAIFGSGTFQIAEMQVNFGLTPYIFGENNYVDERLGDDYKIFFQNQYEKQIAYYNTLFGKTPNENTISASSGFLCGGMNGVVVKTDGVFGLFTEISAISGITIKTTPLSDQFPLFTSTIIPGAEAGELITNRENIFSGYYWAQLPTRYGDMGGVKYFISSVTQDNHMKPYIYNVNGKNPNEYEGIYNITMKDCTIPSDDIPSHLTIHFIPPEGAWSGQTRIDYRPLVNKRYTLQFSAGFGKLSDVLIVTNSGETFHSTIKQIHPAERMVRGEMEYIYVRPENQPYCLDGGACSIIIDPGLLRNISSIELFYSSEKK